MKKDFEYGCYISTLLAPIVIGAVEWWRSSNPEYGIVAGTVCLPNYIAGRR